MTSPGKPRGPCSECWRTRSVETCAKCEGVRLVLAWAVVCAIIVYAVISNEGAM